MLEFTTFFYTYQHHSFFFIARASEKGGESTTTPNSLCTRRYIHLTRYIHMFLWPGYVCSRKTTGNAFFAVRRVSTYKGFSLHFSPQTTLLRAGTTQIHLPQAFALLFRSLCHSGRINSTCISCILDASASRMTAPHALPSVCASGTTHFERGFPPIRFEG